jgi:hypothetical protein
MLPGDEAVSPRITSGACPAGDPASVNSAELLQSRDPSFVAPAESSSLLAAVDAAVAAVKPLAAARSAPGGEDDEERLLARITDNAREPYPGDAAPVQHAASMASSNPRERPSAHTAANRSSLQRGAQGGDVAVMSSLLDLRAGSPDSVAQRFGGAQQPRGSLRLPLRSDHPR